MKRDKKCDLLIDSIEDAPNAELQPHDSPAAASPSYRLAFTDEEFMLRPELRSARLQLELMKPHLLQDEQGVESTIFATSILTDRADLVDKGLFIRAEVVFQENRKSDRPDTW